MNTKLRRKSAVSEDDSLPQQEKRGQAVLKIGKILKTLTNMQVQLLVYDLSKGMAATLSRQLIGKHIEAIYHTSVVVFNKEFYFGQGIYSAVPYSTDHGNPINVIDMGLTHIPIDVFDEFINEMKVIYTAEKYHLLDNNCNNFTNQVCNFLVGKDIPSYITGLPSEVLSTPFGQALRPMLENMFGPSKITSNANQSNSNQSNSITQTPLTAPPTQQKQILHVKDQAIFDKLLKSHKCVIVDFTGQNCPPCRVISPIFEDLIIERMSPDRDIIGISVETSQGYLIAKKYQITATPTFIFFLDGKQFHSFRGANKQELVSWIDLLLYTAYPPHKHSNLKISFIETRQIILFSVSMNLDAVFIKANEYISRHDESKLELLNEIKTSLKLKYDVKSSKSLSCSNFNLLFKNIYDLNVDPTSFALLDILRLLIIDENIQGLIKSNNDNWIMKILLKVVKSSQHKAIMLMSLRLSCNLFFNGFNPISNELIENSMTCRSIIACLLIESLLNSDINIRNVAVSLAFNISIRVFEDRNNIDDEFTCEIIAAVFKALEDCNDDFEVVFKLMVSLGFLIYKASDDCIELVNALGGITVFQDKIEKSKGKVQHDKINKVVVDLKKLI